MTGADQHAPSTGQPGAGVVEEEVLSVTYLGPAVTDALVRLARQFRTEREEARAKVESLQQQLAAAQAERDLWLQENDRLRLALEGLSSGLAQEGLETSRAQYEAMRGAMREVVGCARTVLSKLRLSERAPYAELVALRDAVETAAALDAASAGQPKQDHGE